MSEADKMSKSIPISTIGEYIRSELVITENGNMIIDFQPPYPKLNKGVAES